MVEVDPNKTLGIIANPLSSRDVRRVVSSATTITAVERANILERILLVLGGLGLKRVMMMPDRSGLCAQLLRNLRSRARVSGSPLPGVEFVDMDVSSSSLDSRRAAQRMREAGVNALVVLGGDGTHRDVASASGDIPIACISTGTNNAFPAFHEATTVGMALGVALSRQHAGFAVIEPNKRIVVRRGEEMLDRALVDVAVTREQWIGSRAVWDPASLAQVFLAFCEPSALGMSSIGSACDLVARQDSRGLAVELHPMQAAPTIEGDRNTRPPINGTAPARIAAVPLTPGRLFAVGIARSWTLELNQSHCINYRGGVLALDGEREIECRADAEYSVCLDFDGPKTLNIPLTMQAASEGRIFSTQPADTLLEASALQ